MQAFFLILLAFIPLAIAASWFHASAILIFFLCVAAIIPLAKFIGEATEQIAEHTDPAIGGFLNATFGNATELIVGILALQQGLIDVIRATIIGSIIGNLLLALGLSMFLGGLRHKKQVFNREGASAMGTTLLLSSIALVSPAIFAQTVSSATTGAIQNLSLFVAAVLILVYAGGLVFSLRTHRHLYMSDIEPHDPRWSRAKSVVVLAVATLAVVWVSDILVNAITPVVAAVGWSPVFVGIVFVAIAGNAAEYASAITSAAKDRMDLALQISMGSATQIAQFVGPVLVLSSLLFANRLNLIFTPYELIAVALSIFIANFVVLDGESNWFEGLQLMAAYVILAAGFFLYR